MSQKRKPASIAGIDIFSQKGRAEPISIEKKTDSATETPALAAVATVPVELPAAQAPTAPAPSSTGAPPSASPVATGTPGHSAAETPQPAAEQKLAPTVVQTPVQQAPQTVVAPSVPAALPKYVPADLSQVPTKALTVKVDLERYRNLKTAGLDLGRSNQDIMVEALDMWLAKFAGERRAG